MSSGAVQRFARASAKGCPEPVLTPRNHPGDTGAPPGYLVEGLIDVGEAVPKGDLREQAPAEQRAGRSDHVGPRPQALVAGIGRRGVLGHRDGEGISTPNRARIAEKRSLSTIPTGSVRVRRA